MNWAYLYTFSQTCALEFPFYAWFLGLRQGRWPKTLAGVIAINAVTHPLVFFLFMSAKAPLLWAALAGEAFAFGFEAFACWYFLGLRAREALLASTLANLFSWQVAPLLTYALFF